MDDPKDEKKKKNPKLHGTFVNVNDENIDEVAKEIVEMFRKLHRERKGH